MSGYVHWHLFSVADTESIMQGNPRSTAIRAVAKANKLNLEIVLTEPAKGVSQDYLKLNPLAKVPTFVGADGYTLTECIAIAIYGMFNNNQPRVFDGFQHDETYYHFSYPCLKITVEKIHTLILNFASYVHTKILLNHESQTY